jgi:hypothetical protein
VDDLATPGTIFQIGVEPIRIDIITAIAGVEFESAWPMRLEVPFADQVVNVLSRDDLIRNKRAAGREQDLLDVEWKSIHPGPRHRAIGAHLSGV